MVRRGRPSSRGQAAQDPTPARVAARPRRDLPRHRGGGARARGQAAQALVEFALAAPVVLLIIGAAVDMGRRPLLDALLSGASADTARQAVLQYYSGSNTLAPDCTALTTPCNLTSLVTGAHLLDPLGVSVIYLDPPGISSPP